jgi:hypothetical protein
MRPPVIIASSIPAGGRPALDENVIARSAGNVAIFILEAIWPGIAASLRFSQ